MTEDRTARPCPPILTVVLMDDAITRAIGEPPRHRTVHVRLTDGQMEALALQWVGTDCGNPIYEQVSMCFLERRHTWSKSRPSKAI